MKNKFNLMNYLKDNDNVNLCYKDFCIHAFGKNGNLIAAGAFIALISVGLYYLSKIK